MSTALVVAVVALASCAGLDAAADQVPALDIEGAVGHPLAPPAAAPAVSPPGLRLVWMDPTGVATGVDARAREEAGALLTRMGASVTWRHGDAGELGANGEVHVILLDRAVEREPGTPVLGATPARLEGASFVWVSVPNVRAILGLSPRGPAIGLDLIASRALGIALGRVVAHEVVHALVPWVSHGAGLMSPSLSHAKLTAASASFGPEVAAAVRAALRGEAPPARPDPGVLAATTVAGEVDQ